MGFQGYERPDGIVGIRNHVAVIASVSCANGVVEAIRRELPRVKPLTHTEGCGRGPRDLVLATRTLCGLGKNPNVAGVLVVGLGCEFLKAPMIADEIRSSGKPVEHLVIQENRGSQRTTEMGVALVRQLLNRADTVARKNASWDRLTFGFDIAGLESEAARTAYRVLRCAAEWLTSEGATVIANDALEGSSNSRLQGRLEYGEAPNSAGLWLMDTPVGNAYAVTGMAAAGAHVLIRSTERATSAGFPIAPVVNVSAVSGLFESMEEDFDVDAGRFATGLPADAGAGDLVHLLECVIGGRATKPEAAGYDVMSILTQGPAF